MARERFGLIEAAVVLAAGAFAAEAALAQAPAPPVAPAPAVAEAPPHVGPLHRAWWHTKFKVHDRFIGYPDQFVEPPIGFYLHETTGVMAAKAEGHRFLLYRSDFVAGSTELTLAGSNRLREMYCRLPGWLGPIAIEAVPDQPGLAEARRATVLIALQQTGTPIGPERVIVAQSPYYGLNGQEAAFDYGVYLKRAAEAPAPGSYPLSPAITTTTGSGAGGGR